jgi:dihydrofolate reductase
LKPSISLVLAVANNDVIGRHGRLPWELPDDLKHFKQVTLGKPVLMGRRTFESIGKALPGRRNLVLSRQNVIRVPGIEMVSGFEEAVERAGEAAELCVIGGAALFALALPLAHRIYLTRVHGSPPGDTHFPLACLNDWKELERVDHPPDQRHSYPMSFITLGR